MFLDRRTIAVSKLVEAVAGLLSYQGLMDLTTLFDGADLQPTTNAAHHAAAAAVHVLLAHDAGTMVASDEAEQVAASNGHAKKAPGAASHQSRRLNPPVAAKPARLKCPQCPKTFSSAGRLERHKAKDHSGQSSETPPASQPPADQPGPTATAPTAE